MYILDSDQDAIKSRVLVDFETHRKLCVVQPCGGGKTVIAADIIKYLSERNFKILCIAHRIELVDQMKKTLEAHGINGSNITVSMKDRVIDRNGNNKLSFVPDCIVTDEAHHAPANSYVKIYEKFPNAKHLGLTATPCRLDGKPLSDIFDKLIIGKSVDELINKGRLSPFRFFSCQSVDMTGSKKTAGDWNKKELIEKTAKKSIYCSAVKAYNDYARDTSCIVYCPSVEISENTAQEFVKSGVSAVSLDGKSALDFRQNSINDFKNGKIKAICNVDLFGEGFDVPNCDSVIMLRATCSLSLFIQQAMRCMRIDSKNPKKVAVIIDLVGNYKLHGLPNQQINWSLENIAKKSSNFKAWECPNCRKVYAKKQNCSACGYILPPPKPQAKQKPHEILDQELVQIIAEIKNPYKNIQTKRPKNGFFANFSRSKKFWGREF